MYVFVSQSVVENTKLCWIKLLLHFESIFSEVEKRRREVSETWNAFIHPLEISVRKMTVDKGSASPGMIAMCGEKQIAANPQDFLCMLWRKISRGHHSVKTNTEVLMTAKLRVRPLYTQH